MSLIVLDRSRVETAEKCPRKRYWLYEHQGWGLEPVSTGMGQLDAVIGLAVHAGLEQLLRGESLEAALLAASLEFSNLDLTSDIVTIADSNYTVEEGSITQTAADRLQEAKALAEGLIRAWAAIRLPKLIEDWEVLAVEQEMEAHFHLGDQELVLLARPDVLHRRKADGAVFIRNFKTVSSPDKTWREQWRYDQQTLSECLAAEQFLMSMTVEQEGRKLVAHYEPSKIGGVIIEGLLKGRRLEYPEGSGRRYQNSPLTQCWYRQGTSGLSEDQFWALDEYETVCQGPHKSGKSFCPGGRTHRLSNVQKVPVWEYYPGGVGAWVTHLSQARPQTLEAQFLELPPILRPDYEIERWKRQVLTAEVIRYEDSLLVMDESELDRRFPQSTASGNCLRPHTCPCFNLCWGTAAADPLNSGYQLRVPNHPREKELAG